MKNDVPHMTACEISRTHKQAFKQGQRKKIHIQGVHCKRWTFYETCNFTIQN
jgi:hypothetical protein